MKKYISFLILFMPWLVTVVFICSYNAFNNLLNIFLLISIIFYYLITLLLYNVIENNKWNKDFLLGLVLLYIFNQYFNIFLFYYKNYIISLLLCLFQIISYLYILKKKND